MSQNVHNSTQQLLDINHKGSLLFVLIGGFFIANAIIAEFIGIKVFSLERTLGFEPLDWQMSGFNIALNLSAGALLWPLEFAIADLINEYFGKRGIKLLSYLSVALISYAFLMVSFTIFLTPADFWVTRHTSTGTINMVQAFDAVFSQGLWIIIGSLVAFLIGQLIDVRVFHWVKERTGERYLWLRATGSTLVSQFIDSFIVLIIAFHINPNANWDLKTIIIIGTVKYLYKFIMAFLLTPVIYLLHYFIDYYLGESLATEMKKRALRESGSASKGV
jgi:hypothetical protein